MSYIKNKKIILAQLVCDMYKAILEMATLLVYGVGGLCQKKEGSQWYEFYVEKHSTGPKPLVPE